MRLPAYSVSVNAFHPIPAIGWGQARSRTRSVGSRPHCAHHPIARISQIVQFPLSAAVLLVCLSTVSVVVTFLVHRKTDKVWVAALMGGSIIPGLWLIDGVLWLNDMAVDDPPPGMIVAALALGVPVAFIICSLTCFLALSLLIRRR